MDASDILIIVIGVIGCFLIVGVVVYAMVGCSVTYKKARKNYLEAMKEEQERFRDLSLQEIDEILIKEEKEQQKEQKLVEFYYPHMPSTCPSCYTKNIYVDKKTGDVKSAWELSSSQSQMEKKFDGATRLWGVTTVHTKNVMTTTSQYRCPKCGHIYTLRY